MRLFSDDKFDNIRSVMVICGTLCVFRFLFAPLAGHWSTNGSSVYLVEGKGEQWGLLILAPLAALLVYRRLAVWSVGVGNLLLLVALWTAWRCSQAEDSPYSVYRAGSAYHLPTVWHWVALGGGVMLIVAAADWVAWDEWGESLRSLSPAREAAPRSFDPRSRNPQADFGFCSFCGARNSLLLTRCHQCHSPLSWATQRTQAVAKPIAPTKPATPHEPWFAAVDWGFWGTGLLSLLFWPLGLLLFFTYSRNGDDKGNAALVGAGLGLLLMALRLLAAMAKVGG